MALPRMDMRVAVAVIGAGSMGGGIAQLAAQAGHDVRLFDSQPGAAARAIERISADLNGAVQRHKLDDETRQTILARLTAADTLASLEGCGIAIEAIVERLEPKQALFRQLEEVLDSTAVLATNTSSISITAVAQGLVHPQRVVGWHFFNPAPRMKLVEIIPGVETDPSLVSEMHALSRAWGKTPVDAPNAPGFIVNRVARPYYAEGMRLLAERIAPLEAIDRLMREAGGFSLGPFELIDLIGADVNLAVTESVFAATQYDSRYAPHLIQQELVRAGHHGRKTGRGFYDYRPTAPKPQALGLSPVGPMPGLRVSGRAGLLSPLIERLRHHGVAIGVDDTLPEDTFMLRSVAGRIDAEATGDSNATRGPMREPGPGDTHAIPAATPHDVRVALTDGRTATERAAGEGPLLLIDLARDFASTPLVGAAASAGAEGALPALASLLQPAGIEVLRLNDVAGLVVMRIVCGLANEAADVMTWNGTRAQDIDIAMVLGTAYPVGPLAWADAIGPSRVATVLAHLQTHYGDARYRRSPRLLRAHFAKELLHA